MHERSLSRPARFAIRFIRTYQLEVRHRLAARCDGESCSDYAVRMFEERGFLVANAKTISKIARCRPPRPDPHAPLPRRGRARRARKLAAITAVLGWLAVVGATFSGPATATVTPGCYGNANGIRFEAITQNNPLRVAQGSTMQLRGGAHVRVGQYLVQLYYFGIRYGMRAGNTTDNQWSGSFNTSQFLTRGTGNYIVRGYTFPDGPPANCVATLYIKVGGDPLESTAGQVGGGLTLAGLGGMLVTAVTGGKVPPGFEETSTPEDEDEIKRRKLEEERQEKEDEENRKLAQEAAHKMCFFMVLPALILTTGAMASGASAGGIGARSIPRARWRPRLSVVGIGSGILFGAGSGILLQQYGVIWPTLGMGIGFLLGGLLLGILVPSLARLRVVRKLNRRFEDFERRYRTTTWAPSHRISDGGIQAWDEPDPSTEVREDVAGGVDVQVVQVLGDWAQVVAENGWSGWVDARELKKLPAERKPRTSTRGTEAEQSEPMPEEAVPADWYPDPSGEARLRYWDGSAWTDNTAD